jgi:LysM repeat protein
MESQVQGDIKKIIREIGDEVDYNWKDSATPPVRHQAPTPAESRKSHFLLAGSCAVLLAAAVLVFFAFRGLPHPASREEPSKAMTQFEQRAERLEKGVRGEMTQLAGQMKSLQTSVEDVRKAEQMREQRLEQLALRMEELEKKATQRNREEQTPPLQTQKTTTSREGRGYIVQAGDTLTKIARQHGITLEELCQLNGVSVETLIYPGQRLVVARGRP